MAEVVALALAAVVSERLNFTDTTFLTNNQQLVQFLHEDDQEHPVDWRIKPFSPRCSGTQVINVMP